MTPLQLIALRQLAESLAADVGRLRRVHDGYLVDRLARYAWVLDGFVQPTAAAIYRENGGNEWLRVSNLGLNDSEWHQVGLTFSGSTGVAVLYFENLSGAKEDEYFRDGMTEDIVTELSKIARLEIFS